MSIVNAPLLDRRFWKRWIHDISILLLQSAADATLRTKVTGVSSKDIRHLAEHDPQG